MKEFVGDGGETEGGSEEGGQQETKGEERPKHNSLSRAALQRQKV